MIDIPCDLSCPGSFIDEQLCSEATGSRSGTPEVQSIITLSGLWYTPPPTLLSVSKSPSQSPSLDSKGTKGKVI